MATASGSKNIPRRSLASQSLFKALGKAADKIAAQTAWRVRQDKRYKKINSQESLDYEEAKKKLTDLVKKETLLTNENKRLSELNEQLNNIIREKTNFIDQFLPSFYELSKELQEMLVLKNGEIENWKRVANVGVEQVEKLREVIRKKEEEEKKREKEKEKEKEKVKEKEKEEKEKEKEIEKQKEEKEKVKEKEKENEKEKGKENKEKEEDEKEIDRVQYNIWEACQNMETKRREWKKENDNEIEGVFTENEIFPPNYGISFPYSPDLKEREKSKRRKSHKHKHSKKEKKYQGPTMKYPLTYEQEIELVKNEIRGIPAKNLIKMPVNDPESDSDDEYAHSKLWNQIIKSNEQRKKRRKKEKRKFY